MKIMDANGVRPCVAFAGDRLVASGELAEVAVRAKESLDRKALQSVLVFESGTSNLVEVDFRGSARDVRERIEKAGASRDDAAAAVETGLRGPGRPRLGVVGREVTLLPRHWDWLEAQPGGASVTLRKLVEESRRSNQGLDLYRAARDAAYKFMMIMAGNRPGFEEACRILFSRKKNRLKPFERLTSAWPKDVREHVLSLFKRMLDYEKDLAKEDADHGGGDWTAEIVARRDPKTRRRGDG